MPTKPEFFELARRLAESKVEFILVGGVAAMLQGAPVSTLDLDILIDPADSQNSLRLLACLEGLDARYMDLAGRDLRPTEQRLASLRIHRLRTTFGAIDILTAIGADRRYSDLRGEVHEMSVGPMLVVRVLDLGAIIRSKEEAGREKDLATLPVLRRTLELLRQRS